jgi:hypothetical protein
MHAGTRARPVTIDGRISALALGVSAPPPTCGDAPGPCPSRSVPSARVRPWRSLLKSGACRRPQSVTGSDHSGDQPVAEQAAGELVNHAVLPTPAHEIAVNCAASPSLIITCTLIRGPKLQTIDQQRMIDVDRVGSVFRQTREPCLAGPAVMVTPATSIDCQRAPDRHSIPVDGRAGVGRVTAEDAPFRRRPAAESKAMRVESSALRNRA